MKTRFLKIHNNDNVIVAIEPIKKDEHLLVNNESITAAEDIPAGHKIALNHIAENENIIKYGHVIGCSTTVIPAGSWVHSHNIKTNLNETVEYSYNPEERGDASGKKDMPVFLGYKRKDGRTATRNEIWIINTVGCVNSSADKLARLCNIKYQRENFDGVFTFSHPFGCSQLGDDLANTQKVLAGLIKNPNAGGVLILGLGCENNRISSLTKYLGNIDNKRIRYFNSQDVADEIEEGIRIIGEIFGEMKNDKREPVPVSELAIGMKCGGSDGFSGLTANPLVGRITDKLVNLGGTVLLTEVPEMFGAEQQLMNRAKNGEVYEKVVGMINGFKKYFLSHNQPVYENPSPGNKDGGITTLEEKSLGAVQKGGTSMVSEVLDYAEQVSGKGLALINAPGNDGVSATALTVSGATMILFTTGRGTPLGFPVPTLKISTNTGLFERKPNWIDFNAGEVLAGKGGFEIPAEDLFNLILNIASGKIKTNNEINEYKEIAIWKDGVTL